MSKNKKNLGETSNERKNHLITKILRAIVLITMVLEIVIGVLNVGNVGSDVSRYFISAFTCLMLLIITFIPSFINEKKIVLLPVALETTFIIFSFLAMYLGEIFRFYDKFWWWDILLHSFSAIILGLVGFLLFYTMNRNRKGIYNLNHAAIALFSFCFALTCGVVWEVFEFSGDMILGMNMQKSAYIEGYVDPNKDTPEYMTKEQYWEENINKWGRVNDPGLMDTMKDLMVDGVGAIGAVGIGYGVLKYYDHKKLKKRIEKVAGVDLNSKDDSDKI